MIKMNCICCDKDVETEPLVDEPMTTFPTYGAIIFRANGNFGSTIFDPMPRQSHEVLQVIICDDCIKAKAAIVTRIYGIKRETVANTEPFRCPDEC